MYVPAVHDESQTFVGYVDQQLDAIRAAPYGLTEAQARECPCRSTLSVAGIVKHILYGMRTYSEVLTAGARTELSATAFGEYMASFALSGDETTVALLREFDEVRERYRAALTAADPAADALAPPAPWAGIPDARPIKTRYNLGHHVEEVARHAGHADIIREQIDGVSVAALVMTREGVPANDYFQPFVPEPGTIDI